jgi:uncharacterized protein YndB with AHSA1/START domain
MRLQDELGAVRRERVLPSRRDTAWELLSDPRELEGWLADEVELDEVREGAEGVLRWAGGDECRVVVEEVAARRRVAMRWERDGGPDTLVEVTLDDDPAGDGTVIRVLEAPLVAVRAVAATLARASASGPSGPVALAA